MSDPSSPQLILRSRAVVLPGGVRPANVVVEDRTISAITDYDANAYVDVEGAEVRDFGDMVIGPGLVDSHVHINEPGRADWEGFRTATSAAAAGGVTTLIDMPLNSSPVTTTADALAAKRAAAADQCWVDVAFYGGLVRGGADRVQELLGAGVAGIKAFMCDSGLDEFPASGQADLTAAGQVLAKTGVPLLAHAELPLAPGATLSDTRRYAEYLASRPKQWEVDAIELLIRTSRETGCRVHVVHLANADALAMLEQARDEGLPITVETCPHYLHFSAEEIPDGDTRFKCAPPIRDAANRDGLWQGLQRGVIDTIGSDHSPCPPAMKELESGDFLEAWGGIAGLQLTLPITWTGAKKRGIAIEHLFHWTSTRPAELFGLGQRKGKLAVGYDADIVVFDPSKEWQIDGKRLYHRHKLTPYDGQTVTGQVVQTLVSGRTVFTDGRLAAEPSGRFPAPAFANAEPAG
ncbi:MAG: allantoinase AllB [Planctomycetota bacterium]